MESWSRLVGVDVADERELAGRIVGWMYVVGTIITALLPLLPGVNGILVDPTLLLNVAALGWGIAALTRVRWRVAPGWVLHAALLAGAGSIAVAVSESGSARSPASFLLMLVLVFAGYFFPAREAWPYLGVVLGFQALPFAYDAHAVGGGLLGELLIVAPCYWLLLFLLVSGKRGMVALRARADELARRDPLTGLANRRALLEAADRGPARRAGDRVGLLVLDVDDFKLANTLHGHPGGDRALCFVAGCLRAAARAGDLPARLGGDEFAVLVDGATADGMAALAQRVLERVRASDVELPLDGFVLRVSAGWALDADDTDLLMVAADRALQAAKRGGKDRVLPAGPRGVGFAVSS